MKNTVADIMKEIMRPAMTESTMAGHRNCIHIFGNKALYEMDERHIAEISLVTAGTSGYYPQLLVVIQHKDMGEMARNVFVFEDYLEREPQVANAHVDKMYIWVDCTNGFDWYIARPKSTVPILKAIFDYIKIYE